MAEPSNDHDLLIEISASLRIMADDHREFIKRYEANHADIVARVTVLENKDSRDSERFKGIADEIRRSLANAEKINNLTTDVNTLGTNVRTVSANVDKLESKSFRWDLIIGFATIVGTILAIVWK
jgi:predicted RNase H-like nuclease (RuvC/YqgF family)